MKEQDYQRKIVKWLEARGHYVVKVVTASKKGVPDIIACVNGHFVGIEVKTPTTMSNTSKLQDYNLAGIRNSAGVSVVACDISDIEFIITKCEEA